MVVISVHHNSVFLNIGQIQKYVTDVLYVNFQDSSRPEIPKQYFSFADVSFH